MSGYVPFPAAQTDLESIWGYTSAHWEVAQAERYTRNIQAACEALSKGELVSRRVRLCWRVSLLGFLPIWQRKT